MHTVLSEFIDKQDERHRYKKGDVFPYDGKEISDERLEVLCDLSFIKSIEPEKDKDSYKDLEVADLKEMLDEKEIKYAANASKKTLIKLLEEAEEAEE